MTTTPLDVQIGPLGVRQAGVDLQLLGEFELRVDGVAIDISATSQRVIALIALNGRPMRRGLAAGVLWPNKSQERANANLRCSLWRLEQLLYPPIIKCEGHALALHRHVTVDIDRLEHVGWAALEAQIPPPSADGDLFLQPLLPGWYDDWVVLERERLAQLQLRFLERLISILVAANELTRALDYAIHLVRLDPFRERSQLCLLSVYAAEGSWGQINRQVAEYEGLMRSTFGCGASATFVSAARELSGDVPLCIGAQCVDVEASIPNVGTLRACRPRQKL